MTPLRFEIETDRKLVRHESVSRYALATLVAPEGEPRERPPVNLGIVLDRSGSMAGEKIRLSRDAAMAAIRRLDPRDRFSVVAYDEVVDVVVQSTAATPAAVASAVRAIQDIEARGSTDLCGGWLRCCEQVALVETPGAVTRVLLLTDGLANAGIVDPAEIARHAAALRSRGIATTTLGVGDDFDEHLLGRMADEGGGHFYYVERDDQIARAIETEVGEALEVTLRDAKLRIEPADAARVTPLAPYPTHRVENAWVIDLGDLVSLQELTLPLRISFTKGALAGPKGTSVSFSFAVASGDAPAAATASLAWTIVPSAEVGAQPRNRTVDRAVAEAYAALARREAGRLNREGEYKGARRQLEQVAARIQGYAGDDSVLNALVRDLQRDAVAHDEEMEASERKVRYMSSYSSLKSRAPSGSSRRTGRP